MENKGTSILETARDFKVSKEQLYQAWITPESLTQWWKPEDLHLQSVENEVQTNGMVNYRFQNSEGADVNVQGEYQEVVEGEKLVYSWNWDIPEASKEDGDFTLTILFKQKDQGSTLEVKQEPFSSPESVEIHKKAWEKALNDLDAFLTNSSGQKNESSSPTTQEGQANEVIGYQELEEQEKVGGYSA